MLEGEEQKHLITFRSNNLFKGGQDFMAVGHKIDLSKLETRLCIHAEFSCSTVNFLCSLENSCIVLVCPVGVC